MKAIFKVKPELDFFIGFIGGSLIPTKQDKFKPLIAKKILIIRDHEESEEPEELSKEYDLYIKKKRKSSHKEFENSFKELIKRQLTDEHPYNKEIKLEVIVSVSMTERRLKEVDIDNLIKSVLDCFNGLVYEDDSQVISVLGTKDVNSYIARNGLFVGIKKITNEKPSWFENIHLAYFDYEP